MSDTSRKQFNSSLIAANNPASGGQTLSYDIDDREVVFIAPDVNQLVMMTSAIERAGSEMQAAALLVSIFFSLVADDEEARHADGSEPEDDEEALVTDYTRRWLETKMFDRKDPFGIGVISAVMQQMLEDWGDRPTQRSSRSSSSQPSRGTTSKATSRGAASTRGRTR